MRGRDGSGGAGGDRGTEAQNPPGSFAARPRAPQRAAAPKGGAEEEPQPGAGGGLGHPAGGWGGV